MKACIRIHNRTISGKEICPNAEVHADEHWTAILADTYQEYPGLKIVWKDGRDREILITQDFWRECEQGFEHIMEFIRLHGLDYTVYHSECTHCVGHEACVSRDEKLGGVA